MTFRVGRTLDDANDRCTYKALTQGASDTANALATTRNRSGDFTFRLRWTFFQVGNGGDFVILCVWCRNVGRNFSFEFVDGRLSTTVYVTKTNRLFLRIVRARTVIGTLLRSATRFTIALSGGSFFDAVLPYTMDDERANETATGGGCVVWLIRCCSSPPSTRCFS